MRLILREYLSLLKEAGEIDAILPDLLLAMGVRPINRPGSGTRQYGVDVPAVGVDPTDSPRVRKLFLITAKQGDIGRSDWNSGNDAVRQSLDDILDSYLAQSVAPGHAGLPVKVVLATGGDLKQAAQASWDGYTRRYQGTEVHGHRVEFEFWGGDVLADLLQRHLVDEYLFPNDYQTAMRRTLAFIGEPDADLGAFQALVGKAVTEMPTGSSSSDKKARVKVFRALRLGVSAAYRWGLEEGNTRPALLLAEYTVLRVWGALARHGLTHPLSNEVREARACLAAWREASDAYLRAVALACQIQDGLYGHSSAEAVEYPLRTFEVMGHLAVAGLDCLERAGYETGAAAADLRARARDLAELLAQTIEHNSSALHPPYDEHAIEVTLVGLLLALTGRGPDAGVYVRRLANRVLAAKQLGQPGVPLFRASYDHLSDLALGLRQPELPSSLLLPRLAELALVLGDDSLYDHVQSVVQTVFPATHLQVWYPDDNTDPAIYDGGGTDTGFTLAPIDLAPDATTARADLLAAPQDARPPYSSDVHGMGVLSLLASRRFRTPLRPSLWRDQIPTP